MVSPPTSFDSQHEDIIHDAQFDYYGKRLATCSSDQTIKIFDVDGDTHTLVDTLKGAHSGPVWAVAWSHPKFGGSLLASASYDGRVIIWRDQGNNSFAKVYEHAKHAASVNSIAWAPHEYGLVLAAGSSDGYVSLIRFDQDAAKWVDDDPGARFLAHTIGVTAVAWAPATFAGSLFGTAGNPDAPAPATAADLPAKQLATAGCDNLVKIWQLDGSAGSTEAPVTSLSAHEDWVRDVAWAPNVGIPATYLASCGQDKAVYVWTRQHALAAWDKKKVGNFSEVVWRVSWSLAGDVLAVAAGDNKVTLWRENVDGEWETVSTLTE